MYTLEDIKDFATMAIQALNTGDVAIAWAIAQSTKDLVAHQADKKDLMREFKRTIGKANPEGFKLITSYGK